MVDIQELMEREEASHDTVWVLRRCYIGHILCLPATRLLQLAVELASEEKRLFDDKFGIIVSEQLQRTEMISLWKRAPAGISRA